MSVAPVADIERRVRSDHVEVLSPFLDDNLRFLQVVEDFSVQQLIA
jgi:hypothetical protein